MSEVFFCSHNPDRYNSENWRHVLSQWYLKTFEGKIDKTILPYDLSSAIQPDHIELIDGKIFVCREQWMMCFKALIFAFGENERFNKKIYENIMSTKNQKDMRTLGRKVRGYDDKVWERWRYQVVVNGNYLQFSQDDEMRQILVKTGDREIVEAAWYDKVWGIGYNESDARKVGRDVWTKNGRNLLGKALMEVRDLVKD